MQFVNNQIENEWGMFFAQYVPDLLILTKVLKGELKCTNIVYNKDQNTLNVYWQKKENNSGKRKIY